MFDALAEIDVMPSLDDPADDPEAIRYGRRFLAWYGGGLVAFVILTTLAVGVGEERSSAPTVSEATDYTAFVPRDIVDAMPTYTLR